MISACAEEWSGDEDVSPKQKTYIGRLGNEPMKAPNSKSISAHKGDVCELKGRGPIGRLAVGDDKE